MEFRNADFGINEMSKDDLNKIALHSRGIIGGLGGGWYVRGHNIPTTIHGYGLKWVATHGVGNQGTLVLTAKSAEAAEYLSQGWIFWLMGKYNLNYTQAEKLCQASKTKYGREDDVLDLVIQILTSKNQPFLNGQSYVIRAWQCFNGNHRWRWAEEWGVETGGLSAPRLSAVSEVLKKMDFSL